MKLNEVIGGVLAISLFLTGCSKESEKKDDSKKGSDSGIWAQLMNQRNNQTLTVVGSNGQPISKAQILIGESLDQPFASNFITTDVDGTFQAPKAWTDPQVVTIAAPGYVRASFFGQMPQGQTFQLRLSPVAEQFELKGKGTGFKTKDSDNLIDFALMIPAIHRDDLFSFNLNMFISPQMDEITVYGNKVQLPSNLSLPRQRESYGLVPVTLDKAQYRMYFDAMGAYHVLTVRGQFPFKQVVADLQNNKPFVEVINYFSVKGGSLKPVSITQTSQSQDLPVDELNFTDSRIFHTPNFGSDEFLLAAAFETFQGELMPTDFKNVPANANYKMVTSTGAAPQLLVALKKTAEQNSMGSGKLSAALIPFGVGVQPVLLPLIENPQVTSVTEVKAQLPALPPGIFPLATYMVLSSVSKQGAGATATEQTTRLWEVYAQDWQSELHLPQWPDESLAPGAKRWEISYFATQNAAHKAIDLSPRILETVTHATHSATDF